MPKKREIDHLSYSYNKRFEDHVIGTVSVLKKFNLMNTNFQVLFVLKFLKVFFYFQILVLVVNKSFQGTKDSYNKTFWKQSVLLFIG